MFPIKIPIKVTDERHQPTPHQRVRHRIHRLRHRCKGLQDRIDQVVLVDVVDHQDEGAVAEEQHSGFGAGFDAEREVVGGAGGGGAEGGGHGFEQVGVGVGPDEEGEVEVGYVGSSALEGGVGGVGGADGEGVCWWVGCVWGLVVGCWRNFDAVDFIGRFKNGSGIVVS